MDDAARSAFEAEHLDGMRLAISTPATGCSSISSPGAFGFTPWLDRITGYYAILGMEISTTVARISARAREAVEAAHRGGPVT